MCLPGAFNIVLYIEIESLKYFLSCQMYNLDNSLNLKNSVLTISLAAMAVLICIIY